MAAHEVIFNTLMIIALLIIIAELWDIEDKGDD